MALRKRRAGKGAVKKAAGRSNPRKRAPGKGHNKPPEDPPLVPPISSWHTDDQSAAQVARQAAYRQQQYRAAIGSSGAVAPPFALAHDPSVLHAVMLKRVAALEETTAKLLTSGEGGIKPRLLDDSDIDEIRSEIETLKTLPPVPAKPPPEAVGAQSKLAKFGEKVLERLAADAAGRAITAASKALWAQYGDQLIAVARAIGEWIANLPPP